MESVLILDAQAVQTLIFARSLRRSGYRVAVLADGKDNYGYHTSAANERFIGPDSHDKEAYHNFMMTFLAEHHFDAIVPMTDESALYVSMYKASLKAYTSVLMPDIDVFMKGYDKNLLMSLCARKGYPHPLTMTMTDCTEQELQDFPYPAIIKPNLTTGGRGMTLVSSYDELKSVYPAIHEQYGECHLQQFVKPGGRQVKVQVMTDAKGIPQYSSVIWKQRFYPVNGGSSCCNVTVDDPKIAEVCCSVLRDISWTGFADFDLIEDPSTGELLIMEINPRIPASVRSAFESGLDYATMIVDVSLGKPLKEYKYESGKTLRHLGFEMLWFAKSKDRWHANPNWFKFCGRDVYYQDISWKDIVPFICGTLGNIKKQLDPEFRKAKSGINI